MSPTLPTEPCTILEAMARMEGFYVQGTRACRNNNPGNIEFGRFAAAHGGILERGVNPRVAEFPTVEAGFSAMRALLSSAYLGLSVAAALNKWAPPVENKTNVYIENVCDWTGNNPDTILTSELLG